MRRFRMLGRATALLALVSTLLASGGFGHVGGDDLACEIGAGVLHDASAHRVAPPSDSSSHSPQHCWLCHFTRWTRAVPAGGLIFRAPAPNVLVVDTASNSPARAAIAGLSPGRSPPTSPAA